MSKKLSVSAVICTFNRCQLLQAALESLATQSLDCAEFEIIVVDNASTDDTAKVVEEFSRRYVNLTVRRVFESRQGLSHARNTGFREARGSYVAYLDDDAVAETLWLEAALETFENQSPKPLAVVGPVSPVYPDGKPAWFNDGFESFDLGDSPCRLSADQSFMGGNAFFQKQVLEKMRGFDPSFGMAGKKLWLGEEVELLLRMRRAYGDRCSVHYDPRVRIHHRTPREKLRVGYVLSRRFLNGKSKAMMQGDRRGLQRLGAAVRSLYWVGRSAVAALVFAYRYRSISSWVSERGAPIAVHLGSLSFHLFERRAKSSAEEPTQQTQLPQDVSKAA